MAKKIILMIGVLVLMISSTYASDTSPLSSQTFPPYYMAKLVGALLLVLLLFFAFTWVMRRFNRFQSQQHGMKMISGMNVGTKERIIIVEVNGQQLLLGVTPGSINKLMDIHPDDTIHDPESGFSASLRKAQEEV